MNGRESKAKPAAKKDKKGASAAESAPSKASAKGSKKNEEEEDGDPRQKQRLAEMKKKEEEKAAKKAAKQQAEAEENERLASIKVSKASVGAKGTRVDKVAARKEINIEEMSQSLREIEEVSASGIDAALAAVTEVTKTEEQKKQALDRHPERRIKAAYKAFEERRLSELKKEQPGLRLNQYEEIMHKEWKKSPENPMNQEHLAYNEKI